MIHVLMIIDRFHPMWGGAENQLDSLVAGLDRDQVTVSIVTRRWSLDMTRHDTWNGVDVTRVGLPGPSSPWTDMMYAAALMWYAIRNRKRIDLVHTHGAVLLGALGRCISVIIRKPNVVKIATAGKIEQLHSYWWGKVPLMLLKNSTRVIAISVEISHELRDSGFPADKISNISNGVDTTRFQPISKHRTSLRTKHGITPEEVVVLFSGRLVKRKGLDLLLESWKTVSSICPEARLWILGSGTNQVDSQEEAWKSLVRKEGIQRVEWLGETRKPEEIYPAADIFAFPSRQEGFSNSLLEAMACGLAPVASQIGGNTDVIKDEYNGRLFPSEDVDALAERLIEMIRSKEIQRAMSSAAQADVAAKYSMEYTAEKYEDLYQSLCHGKASPRVVFLGTYSLHPRQKLLLQSLREYPDWHISECWFQPWGAIQDKTQIQGVTRLIVCLKLMLAYPVLAVRYLLQPRHDAVIIMHAGLLDVLLLGWMVKLRRKPLIWDIYISLYDTLVNDRGLLKAGGLRAKLLFRLERAAIRFTEVPFLDTRAHAVAIESLYALPQNSIHVVHVGVDNDFLRLIKEYEPLFSHEGGDTLQLLFYGKFIPLHGVPTLVKAANKLQQEGVDFHLTLVGSGQTASNVDALIADLKLEKHITRISWLDYPELVKKILTSDICMGIFGTSEKARKVIPNKIYQVAASGKPFITAATPAMTEFRELTRRDLPCKQVPAGDPKALAEGIRQLAQSDITNPEGGFAFDLARVRAEFLPLLNMAILLQVSKSQDSHGV